MEVQPDQTLHVTTYDDLHDYARSFARRHHSLLIVLGKPGLGKSRCVRAALGREPHLYLNAHVTPLALYQALYEHRGTPIVLDDVDSLLENRVSLPILKAACDSEPRRQVRWLSSHPGIGDGADQTPPVFATDSPICLLVNGWALRQRDLAAILDRALSLRFEPSLAEVHRAAWEWFSDAEVYRFIGRHYALGTRLSFRTYGKAADLKASRPADWPEKTLELMGVDQRTRAMVRITDDTNFLSEEQRVEAFLSSGLGSRATYYRWKSRLLTARQTQLPAGSSPAVWPQNPAEPDGGQGLAVDLPDAALDGPGPVGP